MTDLHPGTISPPVPDDAALVRTLRSSGAGRRVFGRFLLERELGTGGMAVVWLARDERLGLLMALKFLPGTVAKDPESINDLRNEIKRGLKLNHPGVVRLYELHEEPSEGLAAIAMEYVDGPTLEEEKDKQPGRCFDVTEPLKTWACSLCDVLTYVHERAKVVHRDLKPGNVMVNSLGDLKVADFGISSSLGNSQSRLTQGASTSGTPAYMSPQQAAGRPVSVADDLYGVGATLYELLSSKPPFFRGHSSVILNQVATEIPPLIAERRKELGITGKAPIPPQWEAAIAACLAKDPQRRPASMRALRDWFKTGERPPAADWSELSRRAAIAPVEIEKDLAEVDRPSTSPEETPVAQAAPRPRAKPGRWLAIAPVLVLILAGLGWWKSREPMAGTAAQLPIVDSHQRMDEDQKRQWLQRARTILNRESLDESQILLAELQCENVLMLDAENQEAHDLLGKSEAILDGLKFEKDHPDDAGAIRERWARVAGLPPTDGFPMIDRKAAAPVPVTVKAAKDAGEITALRAKLDDAQGQARRRLEHTDFRLAEAEAGARVLVREAVASNDSRALEEAANLNRLIAAEKAIVDERYETEKAELGELLAQFRRVLAETSGPDWEQTASRIKAEIEQRLKPLDYHQDETPYSGLYREMVEARRRQEKALGQAALTPVTPKDVVATPASGTPK